MGGELGLKVAEVSVNNITHPYRIHDETVSQDLTLKDDKGNFSIYVEIMIGDILHWKC